MKEYWIQISCGLLVVASLCWVFAIIGPSPADVSSLNISTDAATPSAEDTRVDGAVTGLGPWAIRKSVIEVLGGRANALVCLAFFSALLLRCSNRFRRGGTLLVLAGLVVVLVHGENVPGFVISCSVVYAFICLVAWQTRGRGRRHSARWGWSLVAVAIVAAAFLYRSRWPQHLQWEAWGISWNLFHLDRWLALQLGMLLWEYGSGRVDRPTALTFATWCALPFTLLGPLLRFSEYERQIPWKTTNLPPLDRAWLVGVGEGMGLVGLTFLTGLAYEDLAQTGWWGRAVIVLTTPLYAYFGTAGWIALFRQAGALGGVALPVSFDRPFRGGNLAEFWSRWHMTVTAAFRDSFFFSRWGLRVPNLYLNSLVLFLAVGLWHGMYRFWLIWGLMQGLGFCAFIAWRQWRAPRLPRPVGCVLVYLFMCFCAALPNQVLKFVNLHHL
jgi:D-alanyl-lipoteichoic acid acyltransferase DltB (MBOAT superfamily)